MSDHIIRGMAANNQVRFFAGTTRDIVETARSIHNTSPVATAALGRLLTAGALMGAQCKNESDVLTLQIQCNGPIGGLTVTADAHSRVKGYVNNPNVILHANDKGKLDVAKALDLGVLSVIKDIGLKEPYVGSTALVSGEIGDDVTAYFAQSEQTPTACALGVLVDRDMTVKVAGGYLVQLLPGAPDEIIDKVEQGIQRAGAVTPMLDQGMTPEDILGQVCGELGVVFLDTVEVSYKCYCTRQRVERALISLGKQELEDIASEGKAFPVECQFCDAVYEFTPEDIKKLLEKM